MFIVGLVLYILSVVGLIMSQDLYTLYGLLILGGVSETGRYYVAYVYAVEIMSKKAQNLAGLSIFMIFAAAKVGICLYIFISNSKDWKYMAYTALAMASYSLITTIFFLHESPRFLEGSKKYDQATIVLQKIQ